MKNINLAYQSSLMNDVGIFYHQILCDTILSGPANRQTLSNCSNVYR